MRSSAKEWPWWLLLFFPIACFGEEGYYSNRTALPALTGSVAAVVLSFNHVENVPQISRELSNEPGIGEIIIAEDGSFDGSKEAWRAALPGSKVVHTENLHEIRAYNNAAKAADSSSSVLCFLQDDDIPSSPGWAREVLELFDRFRSERLGVISGLAAEMCQVELGERQVDHPSAMKNFKKTQKIPYRLLSGTPFMFVTEAWLSPMCVRKDVWRELGGYDETLAQRGEPGIGLDIHLSLRAGVRGYTVGVHGATFERGVGGHGSVSNPKKEALRLKNRQAISLRIRQVAGCRWPPPMLRHAELLNNRYLAVRDGAESTLDEIDAKCAPFVSRPCVYRENNGGGGGRGSRRGGPR